MRTIKSFIFVFVCVTLTGCYNWNGENHAKAEKEAKAYVEKARKAGADMTFVGCTDHDTDNDGYLACDFIADGQPVTLDCAGKSVWQDNHGCKAFVAKMRVTAHTSSHTSTRPRSTTHH